MQKRGELYLILREIKSLHNERPIYDYWKEAHLRFLWGKGKYEYIAKDRTDNSLGILKHISMGRKTSGDKMKMIDYTTITPRMYAAHRRAPLFGSRKLPSDGKPEWRKIGRGLIAAHDGGFDRKIVYAGHVFAVEIHGGRIGIASYRTRTQGCKAYTINTARLMAATRQFVLDKWPITYDEMRAEVRNTYPTIVMPDPTAWYAEYGLTYHEATHTVSNPLGLREEV